jgi:hypothetical protein
VVSSSGHDVVDGFLGLVHDDRCKIRGPENI